jgi:hypothetical protein
MDQIDNVIAAPRDETHIDPSPPAELPPSPPEPDHYDIPHSDIPPGSVLDNIMRGHNIPGLLLHLSSFSSILPRHSVQPPQLFLTALVTTHYHSHYRQPVFFGWS